MATTVEKTIGMRFGRWLVLDREENDHHYRRIYLCRCDCGKEKAIRLDQLKNGESTSCGCYHKELNRQRFIDMNFKHGAKHSSIYNIWRNMMARCYNPKNPAYKNYGDRGISVCKRWHKFINFLSDMGPRPNKLTLERKKNNNNYSPSNCRWATRKEQCNNYRRNVLLEYRGNIKNITQWANEFNVAPKRFRSLLLSRDWSIEKVAMTLAKEVN